MTHICVQKDTIVKLDLNGVKVHLTQEEAEDLYNRLGRELGKNQNINAPHLDPWCPTSPYTPILQYPPDPWCPTSPWINPHPPYTPILQYPPDPWCPTPPCTPILQYPPDPWCPNPLYY